MKLRTRLGLAVLAAAVSLHRGPAAQAVPAATAQGEPTAERAHGSVFRRDIDALVARLHGDAWRAVVDSQSAPPLGGDSVLATAQILCAMGHCHRRYHASDGPVVRSSLALMRQARDSGDANGDVELAAWVADALAIIDPHPSAAPAASGSRRHSSPFATMVADIVARAAKGPGNFPQDLGAAASQRGRELLRGGEPMPGDEAAQILVQLVACQVANRQLDRAADGEGGPRVAFTASQERGLEWLMARQQNGVFAQGGNPSEALTGFGLMALQTMPKERRPAATQAAIDAGLQWLLRRQNADGTWGQSLQNYTTCVAIGALRAAGDPAAAPALARARHALLSFQHCERSGYQTSDRDYGSIGYGGAQRGDLSNLQFAMQALRDTGLTADHEAFAKAVVFLQRTQNLRAYNDFSGTVPDPDTDEGMLDATSGNDGGAGYYPGNSSAGYIVHPDGKAEPRSYGSMTYALLKAYMLAGVAADDPRVVAAVDWIRSHWNLDINPGVDPALGEAARYQGLFYCYLLMAQALDLLGVDAVQSASTEAGTIDWRSALREKLEAMQGPDGAWLNQRNGRWMESEPMLCTCYALLALGHCR
ncbi:MAG: terpene cyclase/mutase family protein [Planctomycetes bacterium]|nr:terpene cyclase/mutase family protein [Planctomycetota bacterium]